VECLCHPAHTTSEILIDPSIRTAGLPLKTKGEAGVFGEGVFGSQGAVLLARLHGEDPALYIKEGLPNHHLPDIPEGLGGVFPDANQDVDDPGVELIDLEVHTDDIQVLTGSGYGISVKRKYTVAHPG